MSGNGDGRHRNNIIIIKTRTVEVPLLDGFFNLLFLITGKYYNDIYVYRSSPYCTFYVLLSVEITARDDQVKIDFINFIYTFIFIYVLLTDSPGFA